MAKALGAPVPVVNRTGAGGAVGYLHVSQQKPDGYAIVWNSNSISTTFHSGQLPFDYKNLEPVARVTIENPVAGGEGELAVEDAEGAGRLRQGQPREGARRPFGRG